MADSDSAQKVTPKKRVSIDKKRSVKTEKYLLGNCLSHSNDLSSIINAKIMRINLALYIFPVPVKTIVPAHQFQI